ncbi:hypothetical protein [Kribbella sp. NPDC051620]|uniref:hypothetical protein n=1 Tax=Kribbella sp. NPDC051620 TaxID=3364120 RepID=UPI00378F6F22
MTYVKGNFGVMDALGTQLQQGGTQLGEIGQTQVTQINASGTDYWVDGAGGNGALGAVGHQWNTRNTDSATTAINHGQVVHQSRDIFADTLQNSIAALEGMF